MRHLFNSIIAAAIACFASLDVMGQEKSQVEKSASPPTLPKVEFRGKDSELARLLKRRYEAAAKGYESIMSERNTGGLGGGFSDGLGEMARTVQRVVTAGSELDPSATNRVKLLEFKVGYWRFAERSAKERFDHGATTVGEYEYSVYMRCDSEIELLRAKQPAAK